MANKFDTKVAEKQRGNMQAIVFLSVCVCIAAVGAAWGASPIEPISFSLKPQPDTKWDDKLTAASLLFEDSGVVGAASMAFKHFKEEPAAPEEEEDEDEDPIASKKRAGDYIFTGLRNGSLVEVELATGKMDIILQNVGDDAKYLSNAYTCGDSYLGKLCGRTFGVAWDQDQLRLMVLDAWKGLYSVDVDAKAKVALSVEDHEGNPYKYLHGLAVSRHTGRVYFTEPSSKLTPMYQRAGVLEAASLGKLYCYDPTEGTVELVASKLYFPTGVAILENKEGTADEAVLVAETSRARIRRWNIPQVSKKDKKKKKGSIGTFADNLPGLPLSLSWNEDRTELIVGCEQRKSWTDSLSKLPDVRKFLGTIQGWVYDIAFPRKAAVLKLNRKGKVQKALSDSSTQTDGAISAAAYKGSLYIGSDSLPYVPKLEKY